MKLSTFKKWRIYHVQLVCMIMVFLEIPLSIFNVDLTFEKNGCMCIRVFTLCFSISVIILSRKMACPITDLEKRWRATYFSGKRASIYLFLAFFVTLIKNIREFIVKLSNILSVIVLRKTKNKILKSVAVELKYEVRNISKYQFKGEITIRDPRIDQQLCQKPADHTIFAENFLCPWDFNNWNFSIVVLKIVVTTQKSRR